jgi:hypothetical protein
MEEIFDLVILGSGSTAFAAALRRLVHDRQMPTDRAREDPGSLQIQQ